MAKRTNKIKNYDVKKYTYRVEWSEEDGEFVGLCSEFPSLSWLDENQELALKSIERLVAEVIDDMLANGEVIPAPFSLRQFSGKLVVRMDPDTHRRLSLEAQEKGVSLNHLINSKLAS